MTPARIPSPPAQRPGRHRPRSDRILSAEVWREVAECEAQLGPRSHSSAVMIGSFFRAAPALSERHVQRLLTEHKRNLRVGRSSFLRPGKSMSLSTSPPRGDDGIGRVRHGRHRTWTPWAPGSPGSTLRRRRSRTRATGASIVAAVDVAAGDKAALFDHSSIECFAMLAQALVGASRLALPRSTISKLIV